MKPSLSVPRDAEKGLSTLLLGARGSAAAFQERMASMIARWSEAALPSSRQTDEIIGNW